MIVQGGSASYDKDDRTPHLSKEDARELLANGLASYRREHKTLGNHPKAANDNHLKTGQ
ncbi:MAG: hypothetical protein JO108_33955 [Acidobacteriaceae bacterium]|nr:hypothetical protein [Acidobacteriaceae bacterium]